MPSPADWSRVSALLDAVLDLRPDERTTYLDAACDDDAVRAEVEALLDAEARAPDFLEATATDLAPPLLPASPDAAPSPAAGQHIGPYRLIEEIGRGGMSVVYRAERTDGSSPRTGALKLLPRYFETTSRIARFRTEQHILASIDHPHIARLLDGGVTDEGRPYLVMEHVMGRPITDYCAHHHAPIATRLDLLRTVCEAVQHAHRQLVVHRDLKPSNILVTPAGDVKLLDFGIAKLLDDDASPLTMPVTRTGERLMTPEYAAPEQIRGEPSTTAVDVYQLGVLAYELFTGRRPFQTAASNRTAIGPAILHDTPARPSAAVPVSDAPTRRALQGDLDTIVMKALRKEPARRYASAQDLADDLHRHRTGQPVEARPATLGYRMRKFLQRNRARAATVVAFLLLAVGHSIFYTTQLRHERDRAQSEAQKAEQATAFLVNLFRANSPTEALGDTVTARELLVRGRERIEALDEQPIVQSELLEVIGQVHRHLGQYDLARPLLERAVALRAAHHGPAHLETASSLDHLGILLCDEGQYAAADSTLRRALRIRTVQLGPNHPLVAQTQYHLAYALRRQGNYAAAEALYRQSLAIRRQHFGNDHLLTAASMSSLATVLHNQGRYADAERLFRAVLDLRRRRLGPAHPDLAMSLNSLAALLMNLGRFEEAEPLLREALAMRRRLFGRTHPKVALTMNNLALALRDQDRFEEAESLFHHALRLRQQRLGPDHIGVAITRYSLAGLMLQTERPDSALALYERALPRFRAALSDDHSFVALTRMGMGSAHRAQGRMAEAAALLHAGFDQIQRIHPDTSLERALADRQLGAMYLARGEHTRADSLLTAALRSLEALEQGPSPRQQRVRRLLDALPTRDGARSPPAPSPAALSGRTDGGS